MYRNKKQMNLSDRIAIESGLYDGKTFKDIARALNRHPATIAREIKNNRNFVRGSFFLNNDCKYARTCTETGICGDKCCTTRCIRCRDYQCQSGCKRYIPRGCSRILFPPYVCNHCCNRRKYSENRYFYSAKLSQAASMKRRSDSRYGIRLKDEQLQELDDLISKQVMKGQPLSHIYAEHGDELPISLRSLYNYIDAGELTVKNIDLRRKTGYKPRKKKKQLPEEANQECRKGRTYVDFQKYILGYPECPVVQMDTVKGRREKGQAILTMLFVKNSIMLTFLIPNMKAGSVVDKFDFLTDILGLEAFQKLFPVILTDNGSEFKKVDKLEIACNGQERCQIFYCDPQASWQKAELEKNHEFIRYVIEKGTSMDAYNENDMTKLMNHINSIKRLGLGNKSPYELVPDGDEDMKWLMELLGMDIIPPDDVQLTPALLKK